MIRLGLLSCAHIHTKGHCEAIAKREGAELAAIWDDDADRGRRYADEFGAAFVADPSALIGRGDLDGFVVCAENANHLELLRQALPAGKPIFCEKPLATTADDAAEALRLIRRHGAPVTLGYGMPFSPAMRGVAKALADGELGSVTHGRIRNAHHGAYGRWFDAPDLRWFTDPRLAGGGGFLDLGTHAVHMVRALLGPVERVSARTRNLSGIYPDVDDYGIALLRMDSGVLMTVEASWVQTGGPGGLEIAGSRGTLYHDAARGGYVIAAPGQEPRAVPKADARPTQVERLLAVIQGQLPADEVERDLVHAADAVAIMQACYRSCHEDRWVDVPRLGG